MVKKRTVTRSKQQGGDDRPNDQRPFLSIPYWSASQVPGLGEDNGSVRPLTNSMLTANSVISWLCPSIRASAYTPGSNLTVEVDVSNAGGGDSGSLALVTVWWDVPTTAFGAMKADRLIGVVSVPVPARPGVNAPPGAGKKTAPSMTKLIPATAPDHICLLARVTHYGDPAGTVADPVGDRHWAQRNLVSTTVSDDGTAQFTFWVTNPSEREATFLLRAKPVAEGQLQQLARVVRKEAIGLSDARFMIYDARQSAGRESEPSREVRYRVPLSAGERRPMEFRMVSGARNEPGQFGAVEILQYREAEELPMGGLGVILGGVEGY